MNKAQALEYFAKYLELPCETCGKSPGELCDTNSVWVHASRFRAVLGVYPDEETQNRFGFFRVDQSQSNIRTFI